MAKAEESASKASGAIGSARLKKALAITALVIAILGTIAAIAAAAATQLWPVCFAILPFAIAIVPSSIFTHIFRKQVSELEDVIAKPGTIKKPILRLPSYDPSCDLDLEESCIALQNRFSRMSIEQLHDFRTSDFNSYKDLADRYSDMLIGYEMRQLDCDHFPEKIVGYALLDRATIIRPEKRPAFYAKSIQLIESFAKIRSELGDYTRELCETNKAMRNELKEWKSEQDDFIRSQEWHLHAQTAAATSQLYRADRRRVSVIGPVINTVTAALSQWELDRMKASVAESYGRRDAEISHWFKETEQAIESAYSRAAKAIERQYAAAKIAAAS
jgi:hypothetical protein